MELPRKGAIVLLRFTLIVAAAYMLLAPTGSSRPPMLVLLLVGGALASNVVVMALPPRVLSVRFTGALMLIDAVWITLALLHSQRFDAEFFFVYFFVLFLAGTGENLGLTVLGAVAASTGYLYVFSTSAGAPTIWGSPSLVRIPFLFTVAAFYGYLVDRTRAQRLAVRREGAAIAELRAGQQKLAEQAAEVEGTLKRANLELRGLSARKTEFISTISHELKNPLHSLGMSLDMLTSGKAGRLDQTQNRFIGIACRSARRLSDIVKDLLDLTRIEAGKLVFRFSEVDLNDLLEEVGPAFSERAQVEGLSFEVDIPSRLPLVWADPMRLEQVLSNLFVNAIKFTPRGGRITLAAADVLEGVEISMSDTGVGLSRGEKERVFERYYQGEDALTLESKGCGLGLSISRKLVEAHGSHISVESEVGKGACFRFELPLATTAVVEMSRFEEEIRPFLSGGMFSILIVDMVAGVLRPDQPPRACPSVLEEVGGAIERELHDLPAQVWSQTAFRRLIIFLAETPRVAATEIGGGLARKLEDMAEAGLLPAVTVSGAATFPDDGTSGRELIEKCQFTTSREEAA